MSWLEKVRAWPQRKKINFMWTVTGTAVVIMVIIWILVGNYHINGSGGANSNIGSLISNIKDSGSGK